MIPNRCSACTANPFGRIVRITRSPDPKVSLASARSPKSKYLCRTGSDMTDGLFGGLRRRRTRVNESARLPPPQRGIVSVGAQQRVVRTLLDDKAAVEHDQP